jgi:hypothetical protein
LAHGSEPRDACAPAENYLSLIRNGLIVVVGTDALCQRQPVRAKQRQLLSYRRSVASRSSRGCLRPACLRVKIAFIAPEPSVTVHMSMGSPARTARSDLARKSRAGLGLHVGPASGLNLNPEHQTGLGLALQET